MPRRCEDWIADTTERIISAADILSRRVGFRGFTMRELVEESALSMGAIYHHFPDRDRIVETVVESFAGIHSGMANGLICSDPPLVKVEQLVRGYADLFGDARFGEEVCRRDVAVWGEAFAAPSSAESYERDLAVLLATLYAAIRDGQRAGRIERHLFAPAAAQAIAATVLGLELLRSLGWTFTPRRMGDALACLVRGLAAPRKWTPAKLKLARRDERYGPGRSAAGG